MAVQKIEIELFERERETIHHDKLKVQRIEFHEYYLKCVWVYESDRWEEDEAIKEHAQLDNTSKQNEKRWLLQKRLWNGRFQIFHQPAKKMGKQF